MIDQSYLDQWPILKDGWEEFDHKSFFGDIWFYKVLPPPTDMFARVYLFVGNNWHRIGLEVRHQFHGYANIKNIGGDTTMLTDYTSSIFRGTQIETAIMLAENAVPPRTRFCSLFAKMGEMPMVRTS